MKWRSCYREVECDSIEWMKWEVLTHNLFCINCLKCINHKRNIHADINSTETWSYSERQPEKRKITEDEKGNIAWDVSKEMRLTVNDEFLVAVSGFQKVTERNMKQMCFMALIRLVIVIVKIIQNQPMKFAPQLTNEYQASFEYLSTISIKNKIYRQQLEIIMCSWHLCTLHEDILKVTLVAMQLFKEKNDRKSADISALVFFWNLEVKFEQRNFSRNFSKLSKHKNLLQYVKYH